MKMRQSIAQMEEEFLFHREQAALEAEQLKRHAEIQSRRRWHAKEQRRGTKRFYFLAGTLVATAVLVTVIMFVTLYMLLA